LNKFHDTTHIIRPFLLTLREIFIKRKGIRKIKICRIDIPDMISTF
jgi:hypothetical protein